MRLLLQASKKASLAPHKRADFNIIVMKSALFVEKTVLRTFYEQNYSVTEIISIGCCKTASNGWNLYWTVSKSILFKSMHLILEL